MVKDNITAEPTEMHETPDYRCLVYSKRVTDDIYLKLCGLERCMPDYCFYTEGRPGYHLHIILEGKGTLCVNGVEQKLHFGQMFVTKPGEDSWYRADSEDPWTYCWMAFDGSIAKESIEKAGFFENVNVLECNIDQQRFYSLVQLLLNNAELKTSAVYYNTGRLLEFIGLAIESYIESEKKIHKSRDYQADSYVEYAVNFIRANYATATISAVAKNIGIHRSYFTTIFKKKTGVSPQEFLLQCRLRRACKLYYGVFEELNIITRAAAIVNAGTEPMWLRKASSMCLELPFGKWDMLHFHGRHCMERQPERVPLFHGVHTLSSGRGMSSHQHNPFVVICDRDANEDEGTCYGLMLMYSGNHKTEIERDQFDNVRVITGINDDRFRWELTSGDTFYTPEVILSCANGLTQLSHNYHRVIRHNVVRGDYKLKHRPVLINNWEATYFDITEERVLAIAEKAKKLGIEMFVLDDGWFKNRNDDNAGLGDWIPDTEKLPDGLDGLIDKINGLGLKFGLWIEPEMVSENSNLYRAHPDWAMTAPNRAPMMARNQLVLDLSRKEVHDYLFDTISNLLETYRINYIKWDFNRPISDVFSHSIPSSRQGEVQHRYYLSLYRLYDRLTRKFPNVLFEGCAGGGGRFDAGMLAYSPQIWCSDNTDPISRLTIQYGTSFGYPACTVGAHVSASPNHQTGRKTPIHTRGVVAMSGTFGYELDLTKLSAEDCAEIKGQIGRYKELEPIIHDGKLYRLSKMRDTSHYMAWQYVSADQSRAVLNIVVTNPLANSAPVHVKLKGLLPEAVYSVDGEFECRGAALMSGGYTFKRLTGDYPAKQLDIIRIK